MARDTPRGDRLSPDSDVSVMDDEIDEVGGGRTSCRSSPRLIVSPKQAATGCHELSEDGVQSAGCASTSSEAGGAAADSQPQDNVLVHVRMGGVKRTRVGLPTCAPVTTSAPAASPAEPPQKLSGAALAAVPTPQTAPEEYHDLTRLTRKRAAAAL